MTTPRWLDRFRRRPAAGVARVRASPARLAAAVAATVLGVALLAFLAHAWRARPGAGAAPSIAVLPFENLGSPDQDYLAEGIGEEILGALSRIQGLRVVGRTSSFGFKGRERDLREVGRELRATVVLEGSVRVDGDRIRVLARLVDTSSGYRLWEKALERQAGDVLAIEDELARAVVGSLPLQLVDGDTRPLHHRDADPAAYAIYLQGRHRFLKGTIEDYRAAAELFQRALGVDPSIAGAWTGLAVASSIPGVTSPEDAAQACARGTEAAERAVALQPDWGVAWLTRGSLRKACRRDIDGARTDLERAAALDPGNASVRLHHGWIELESARLPLALREFAVAVELDPLSAPAWVGLGYGRMAARDLPGAAEALHRARSLAPRDPSSTLGLGIVALLAGDPVAAAEEFSHLPEPADAAWARALLGRALGRPDDAEAARAELVSKFGDESPFIVAEVFAWKGDAAGAVEWLERSVTRNDRGLAAIRYWPLLDPVRDDPRFVAFVERLATPAP